MIHWKPDIVRVSLEDEESGEKASFREGRPLLVTCEVNLGFPVSSAVVRTRGNGFLLTKGNFDLPMTFLFHFHFLLAQFHPALQFIFSLPLGWTWRWSCFSDHCWIWPLERCSAACDKNGSEWGQFLFIRCLLRNKKIKSRLSRFRKVQILRFKKFKFKMKAKCLWKWHSTSGHLCS